MAEVFSGIPTSHGLGCGPAQVVRVERPEVDRRRIARRRIGAEQARFDSAVAEVMTDLERTESQLRDDNPSEQARLAMALIASHKAVLNDPLLIVGVHRLVSGERLCAEWALERVLGDLRTSFARLANPELRDWWRDVEALAATLLRHLIPGGDPRILRVRAGAVLVARRLSVGDAIAAIRAGSAAIVLEEGSLTSHVAILCRSAGLPAVVAVDGACARLPAGRWLQVDGTSGRVRLLEESASERAEEAEEAEDAEAAEEATTQRAFVDPPVAIDPAAEPLCTADGQRIILRANLDLRLDAGFARQHGTLGVGLMRTVYQYAGRDDLPDEDELAALYTAVVADFAPEPVSIRLLDLGGPLDQADLPETLRNLSDSRGIRLISQRPAVVETQLRALCRAAAAGRLRVLLPFVTHVDEVRDLRARLARICDAASLPPRARPELGAMVEVPAAVLMVEQLAEASDFLAIGTNDLSQFLFAVRREATTTMRAELPPPALLRAIEMIAAAGRHHGIDVCLCGEWASEPSAVGALLRAGLRELSVSPTLAPAVRAAIADCNIAAG